jgi:limonene-1,2-epoxide hydrolase
MKIIAATLAALAATVFSHAASAQVTTDDLKWVNQCISDNKGEKGATPAIVRAYCVCMNEKMDDNETRSITQWEKANPKARVACEKQAGWK